MAKGTKGIDAIRGSDEDVRRERARDLRHRDDPPPLVPRGDNKVPPGGWTPHYRTGLPTEKGCEFPIACLGLNDGVYYLADTSGQFRALPTSFFNHAGLQDIFGAVPNYPEWCCPRFKKKTNDDAGPVIESFKDDKIRRLIFRACHRAGPFDPSNQIRGRGAWRLKSGDVIYHAGEELWMVQSGKLVAMETGTVEGLFYPRMAALPAPWPEPITLENNPSRALLETFRKWSWERPAIDPVMLLGWIGVAFLGGALDWRSAMFLIGDWGTGKSTLQKGIKQIFGAALFQSADTTAAGIYQTIGQDARPVAVDELEAEANHAKVDSVVRLARVASSGDVGSRGGAGGTPTGFQMRSAFLFSAINNPLQNAQDLSRVAILRLRRINADQVRPPPIDTDVTGRMVLAQLLREWPRFPETLEQYKRALGAGGHSSRGQDTYGTLLACADLMLGPELSAELGVETVELDWWSKHMATTEMPEIEDATPNWKACIEWLLTTQVEPWRSGVRSTVGQLLRDLGTPGSSIPIGDARRDLEMTGLGLIDPGVVLAKEEGYLLAVPNRSQLVAKLFAGTQWAGAPGAGGPWKDALRQGLEHNVVVVDARFNRQRINGVQQRCTLIVLDRFHKHAAEQ